MAKVKIEVVKQFYDKENNNRQIGAGHIIEVSDKRADELIAAGKAKEADKSHGVTFDPGAALRFITTPEAQDAGQAKDMTIKENKTAIQTKEDKTVKSTKKK